jgi:hypothetical protein
MMHRTILGVALTMGLCTSGVGRAAAQGPIPAVTPSVGSVRHVPVAEAEPAKPMTVIATVSRGWEADLELRYRPVGSVTWQRVVFTRRDQETYIAVVPADAVTPPGIEYFIVTVGNDASTRFASAESPHRVNVFLSAKEVRRKKHLERHDNRRAKIRVAGEYVDYGTRVFGDTELPDRYLRIDGEVGYRVLNFPLKTLSFGYTYLVGDTPPSERGDDGSCRGGLPEDQCPREVGFRGSGWFQLNFLIVDGLEFDIRGLVLATPEGFNVGGRGELRIGDGDRTHVGVGTELLVDVGYAGYVRLGWDTVPGLPMAATVEVTNFPAPHRAAAIRLVYDVNHPFKGGVRVGARLGYQARDQLIGGLTLGLNASLEF